MSGCQKRWAAIERLAQSGLLRRAADRRYSSLRGATNLNDGCTEVHTEIGAGVIWAKAGYDAAQDNIVRVEAAISGREIAVCYTTDTADVSDAERARNPQNVYRAANCTLRAPPLPTGVVLTTEVIWPNEGEEKFTLGLPSSG
jgi:hypothetical protein